MNKFYTLALLWAGMFLDGGLTAQSISLDSTFGLNGVALTPGGQGSYALTAALQPDGKIIVGGDNYTNCCMSLVRFSSTGELDSSFGAGGHLGSSTNAVAAMALQNDGKIVIAGSFSDDPTGATGAVMLARYHPDGSPDTTFGLNGLVTTFVPGVAYAGAYDVAIQPDGKIVVAGGGITDLSAVQGVMIIVRYEPDGSLDEDFGSDGLFTLQLAPGGNEFHAVAIQADGKIVAAGAVMNAQLQRDALFVRVHIDGTLDKDFGIGGIVRSVFERDGAHIHDLALQPDGKILAGGWSYLTNASGNIGNSDFTIARLLANGTFDPDFGDEGSVIIDLGSKSDIGRSLALQPDGSVLLTGDYSSGLNNTFAVIRVDLTGTLDNTFGNAGIFFSNIGPEFESARRVLVQPDGKFLLVGGLHSGGQSHFAVARYHNTAMIASQEPATKAVRVYPNPATDFVRLDFGDEILTGALPVAICDPLGRVVARPWVTDRTIDISELKPGFYFVRTVITGKIALGKFIKK
jgi:uncharacterized delta-60 repeat protein